MNKARQIITKMSFEHSMTRRLLAHNAEMLLDTLEALELKHATLTLDDGMNQITICVKNKNHNVCYTITAEGMEWEIVK
jgi:hypothetical protein